MLQYGCDVLSFDILLNESCDILNDSAFEQLLKLCFSGAVGYGSFSPSCGEYSRLKLREGGPRALRTPQHLDGIPNLSADDLTKVQESHIMFSRCALGARAVFASGGHSHVEQPSGAMSWQEPIIQQFISEASCTCAVAAACQYGKDWYKSWLFASTSRCISSLACSCDHPPNSHQQIAGAKTSSGEYLSRSTAEYPTALCQKFADVFNTFVSKSSRDFTLSEIPNILPIKSHADPPFPRHDGGGIVSTGDWSAPKPGIPDSLQTLRKNWMEKIITTRLDKKLMGHFHHRCESAPFSEQELKPFKRFLEEFLLAQGHSPNWTIPADQPMALHILASLSQITHDPDTSLFQYLINGVPTGFSEQIEPSHCFPLHNAEDQSSEIPLSVHFANWGTAEDHPDIVSELVAEEVEKGWVVPFEGSLEDAQQKWPLGVSVGKLGLALTESRPPRLVVDYSISGVNQRCLVPEHSTLPTARDVQRSYPIRGAVSDLMGFSLDVKSAHKRVAVHPDHRGLLGFQHQGKLFFYSVCPFGAIFSAHFWSRVGGFFLRTFHILTWLAHASFLYVDDFLMYQQSQMMPVSACMICILVQLVNLPISWKKCELDVSMTWIGWKFNFRCGYVELPENKLQKIRHLLKKLRRSDKTSRSLIEQFLGLLMWITQLFGTMRTWMHPLYRDLHSIPASQYSVDPGMWDQVVACLNEKLQFTRSPAFSAIPKDSQLIQVRHQKVETLSDVRQCYISDRRIWLRIRDKNSSRRRLSPASQRSLDLYDQWLSRIAPLVSLWPKQPWKGLCVADAYASGSFAGIGGVVNFPCGHNSWFSLPLKLSDFERLQIPIHQDLQKDISSLETLAQIGLLYVVALKQPGFRMNIRVPALSDNTGAESVSNKLFTTTMPLALFLEKFSLLAASSGISFDVSHIAGKSNILADALSRWNGDGDIPGNLLPHDRIHLTLDDLWSQQLRPQLLPIGVQIPWQFPS